MKFIIYPLLGAFIGYLTNWLAITLLFRPRRKILGVQGLIVKRKELIAVKAGEIISQYLLNTQEISKSIDKKKVRSSISKLVDKTLSLIPDIGRKFLAKRLADITYYYFFDRYGTIKEEILELAVNDSDLENIVRDKIMNYDIGELEYIIKKASGAEIAFILWSGAMLGLIVGVIEALLPL